MKQQTILMDVDGVLLDLLPSVQEYVHTKFNKRITPSMITSWDWDYALGIPVMSDEFWDFIWNSELPLFPGALTFIKTLQALNFKVIAVSQRSKPAAIANAERQFPAFGFDDYILCSKYEDKVRIAHEIGANWALEDNPKIAASLGRGKNNLKSYLIDRPWNKNSIALTKDYTRINNYYEFLEIRLDITWGLNSSRKVLNAS